VLARTLGGMGFLDSSVRFSGVRAGFSPNLQFQEKIMISTGELNITRLKKKIGGRTYVPCNSILPDGGCRCFRVHIWNLVISERRISTWWKRRCSEFKI
jgi:hypothetical protein